MTSDFSDGAPTHVDGRGFESIEFLLFDSLVHHLVEKGVLTRNDALSVVQTAAEVVNGRTHELDGGNSGNEGALSSLKRIYASFEALPNRTGLPAMDGRNVHMMRLPLHDDSPRFPTDDD